MVGSLKMNTALEYSTRVVQEGDRRCKKSTLNELAYLTPLRIPLMNPALLISFLPVFYQGIAGLPTARTCTAILCNSWGETFAAKVPALWTVCTTFPKLARNISIQWPHTWLTTIYTRTRSWAALRGWDPPPYDRSSVFSDPWDYRKYQGKYHRNETKMAMNMKTRELRGDKNRVVT
jgi:hypothetical protein